MFNINSIEGMATDTTLSKIKEAFEQMRKGFPAVCSYHALGINNRTFYAALRDYPELKSEYHKAVAQGAQRLMEPLLETEKGRIFALSRGMGKYFGRHREDEIEVTLSDHAKKTLTDKDSSGVEKMQVLATDFYNATIDLPLYERLVKIVKDSHPDLNQTDLSGTIIIQDAITPRN